MTLSKPRRYMIGRFSDDAQKPFDGEVSSLIGDECPVVHSGD